MQEFSMQVYADGIISGLQKVRPDWEIIDLLPRSYDRKSKSLSLRIKKYYERFWSYPRQVQQQDADIFHIIESAEAHIVYWLQKSAKPAVVTCHDLINLYYRENLQGSVQIPFISDAVWKHAVKGMRLANHIISVSEMTAKDTNRFFSIEPGCISVVPNAVDEKFKVLPSDEIQTFRAKYGLNPDTICLLNVGANHPRKNIANILESLVILKQKNLEFKFWKVGVDFTDIQKEFIKNHDLESHIHYLGMPDNEMLTPIYNAADILLAPSLHEGFGMTLLEAMACGTAVITSNTSAMPEVVGDAGILVNPKDSQAIANAVISLQNDPVFYRELVNKGIERAKLFTWEAAAEQIAQIYEKVVQSQKLFKNNFSSESLIKLSNSTTNN
ncbi:glycosyltransferase family 1 protein [Calothrix sp. 336/3]|uniref:glycosyltransferase family 4 protein n=2 Tax=Calothrix sp. 336/3 TaxID=1337936 RepID=UPI001EDD0305|nr:glycosyltransferase family 1 protein [Calothrix sp. 336/3]